MLGAACATRGHGVNTGRYRHAVPRRSVNVRLDDDTHDGLRSQLRHELGCSLTGFYEAVTRLYRQGGLPPNVVEEVGVLAREVDEQRGSR
jgi:hypothetical protein